VFERFSDQARRVLALAQEEARLLDHGRIGTEHILLGLIHEGSGVAAQALERCGISLDVARNEVRTSSNSAPSSPASSPPLTPRAKKVLELSLREATQLGHHYIGTEHLLLGLTREGEGVAVQVLHDLGVELGQVRQEAIRLLPESRESAGGVQEGVVARVGRPSRGLRLMPHPMRWWRVRMWRSAIAQRGCRHEWSPWQVIDDRPKPYRKKKCSKCTAVRVSQGHR
jgi:ATP-dependent Clp protease ATP-binding subunit ClpA